MKHSAFLLAAVLAAVFSVQAESKTDINGSFERCRADSRGFAVPEGWVRDKQSKKIKYSATTEEVRSGKFSLYIETEENSISHLYHYPVPIKAKAGDTIVFTVYGKGEGTFHIGAIAYSDEDKSIFLRTLAPKAQKVSDGENWKKFTFTLRVGKQKRKGKEYQNFRLRPTIIVRDAAEFALDDLSYEKKEGGAE